MCYLLRILLTDSCQHHSFATLKAVTSPFHTASLKNIEVHTAVTIVMHLCENICSLAVLHRPFKDFLVCSCWQKPVQSNSALLLTAQKAVVCGNL